MAVVGKIDKSGVLHIARAGHFVEQVCPHGELKNCSHHCPLFGEPFWNEKYDRVSMSLCGRLIIMFDSFLDERENPNKQQESQIDD